MAGRVACVNGTRCGEEVIRIILLWARLGAFEAPGGPVFGFARFADSQTQPAFCPRRERHRPNRRPYSGTRARGIGLSYAVALAGRRRMGFSGGRLQLRSEESTLPSARLGQAGNVPGRRPFVPASAVMWVICTLQENCFARHRFA